MNTKKFLIVFSALSLTLFSGFGDGDKDKRLNKPGTNDDYKYISVNNILMWISNNGDGSHDPRTDGNGFYWPEGLNSYKSAIFEDGLVYGAKVNGQIRVNGNTHRQGLQAGNIINGVPGDADDPKFRIYKIRKEWESLPAGEERRSREKDYNEWPIEDGAPYEDVNGDGKPTPGIDKPRFIGDETLWYVANDMDTARCRNTYGSNPMGVEFQTTVFGFDRKNTIGDVVFKKYLMINKGQNNLTDMYVALWSDPDMGDANDDYIGCDTSLSLAYAYNGDNDDGIYGIPPAVGYTFLQGPVIPGSPGDSAKFMDRWIRGYKNLRFTSFIDILKSGVYIFVDPRQGVPDDMYNYLQGLVWNGDSIVNPVTQQVTKFVVPGDPVSGTGWYEGPGWPGGAKPGDRRMITSFGPFNLSPGDTQEVVFAIHITRGYDRLNSITRLREQSRYVQKFYDTDFNPADMPGVTDLKYVPQNNSINLVWDNSLQNFTARDHSLTDSIMFIFNGNEYWAAVTDSHYRFEGYIIRQYRNANGDNPETAAVIDVQNGISRIHNFPLGIFGQDIPADPLIQSPDEGIASYITITKDAYTGSQLYNGSDYYFGVTAYAYSKFSDPVIIESKPVIIKAIPGITAADIQYAYPAGSIINFNHEWGNGDAEVYAKVMNPEQLNGHQYEVTFRQDGFNYYYTLKDLTTGDTLIADGQDFNADSIHKPLTDGFILMLKNTGYENLRLGRVIESVQQTKGAGGAYIQPKNVFSTSQIRNMSAAGDWTITAVNIQQSASDDIQQIDFVKRAGSYNYEIRFTETGSEYYTTGYGANQFWRSVDPKGKGRLPFEVWRLPNDTSEQPLRLIIKTFDSDNDTAWSADSGKYETIYAFIPTRTYSEPLPPTSDITTGAQYETLWRLGNIVINGTLPAAGTVIKLNTWKAVDKNDKFKAAATAPIYSNLELAKQNINNITAFPNPYYGTMETAGDYPDFIRFTNLPEKAVIRIFSLAGVYITKLEKDGAGQYLDWNLRNKENEFVGSGIYLAYIELPGIGTRVMKVAVVR